MDVKFSTKQHMANQTTFDVVEVLNPNAPSPVLLICEHASNFFPPTFNHLGLSKELRQSHIAWDPGALAVTKLMSEELNAEAVVGKLSRLIYDCNRPPDSEDAVRTRSEIFDVPGNQNLTLEQRQARVDGCFLPFTKQLEEVIARRADGQILVTIHSFTPKYQGQQRDTEIGILHDEDSRLADAMLEAASCFPDLQIDRNTPYGPEDGVTYTLKKHGIGNGLLNVMIEVRNDLIVTAEQQAKIASLLCEMLKKSMEALGVNKNGGELAC